MERADYWKNEDLTFFLDFVPDAKGKIAFASSLGKEPEIGSEFWTAAFSNLKKFDGVAVREESTAKTFSEQIVKKVEWVCDPTMLLWACSQLSTYHSVLFHLAQLF